jgi:hypothetical protein
VGKLTAFSPRSPGRPPPPTATAARSKASRGKARSGQAAEEA